VPIIEVDQETDEFLAVAARVAGISKGEVVAQLIDLAKADPSRQGSDGQTRAGTVPIFADYEGHRTLAQFIRGPGRIEITDGPLAGSSFKTPSEAAREVVRHYNPSVSANRNGWTFWQIVGNGAPLQTIRYEDV
jgi:hypothetical protein